MACGRLLTCFRTVCFGLRYGKVRVETVWKGTITHSFIRLYKVVHCLTHPSVSTLNTVSELLILSEPSLASFGLDSGFTSRVKFRMLRFFFFSNRHIDS